MKYLLILLAIHFLSLPPVCSADLSDLDDDQLLRGLHGHNVEGYSTNALEAELKGEGAPLLVERCKNNDDLRGCLKSRPWSSFELY